MSFNNDFDALEMKITSNSKDIGIILPTDEIIPGEDGAPTRFRRKVRRQVQVPFTRKVKVPIITKKVVECQVPHQVETQKLEEYTEWVDTEESYTVYEDQPATRMKKIWLQETVEETYISKVPVNKIRIVQKPVTQIVEEDDFQLICVKGTKMVDVTGWRIDQIERKKVVEDEEFEIFEFIPHKTGEEIKGEETDLGRVDSEVFRYTGDRIYAAGDLEDSGIDWNAIDEDDYTEDERISRQRLYINSKGGVSHADPTSVGGYTSLEDWNANFEPVEEEGFDLQKCLNYVQEYLTDMRADVDPKGFRQDLEDRWLFVDADSSGRVSLQELRTAVWEREEDNLGVPMPKGKFAKALQDVVDQIFIGCGSKDPLSFWHFTNYLLGPEELMVNIVVPTPGPECAWAHAPE